MLFRRRQFIQHSASLCLLMAASPLWANPTGGTVVAGDANIQSHANTTVITQTSSRAIVNWEDFSINHGENTQFVQPNNKSVTLNRVTGGNPSHILGNLSANGQVFLINPNGILFGKTARVDVGGLVASTADINNHDFMAGNYHFTGAPTGSYIINEGSITVRDAGMAALVAPHVANYGIIQATLGTVALGAGDAFTLDLYGDDLITFDISSSLTPHSLEQQGMIEANGGTVLLSVADADQLLDQVMNISGHISATSVTTETTEHQGKIILQGGENTTINLIGIIDVSGKQESQSGGLVQASAGAVHLFNSSFIDASGFFNGGTVHIGGEYQGEGTLPHANIITMEEQATINASALQTGDGGEVVLWSENLTQAHGNIFAQGGSQSGNGGSVETSSHQAVDFVDAKINTTSIYGENGTWLIDPTDINVDDAMATTLTANLVNGNVVISTSSAGSDPGNVTFNNTSVSVDLTNNNSFTVIADNDITFNATDAITATNQSSNIALVAGNDIIFNDTTAIQTSEYSGTISASANNDITFNAVNGIYSPNTSTSTDVIMRADADANGVGTITSTVGGSNIISAKGTVTLYYNPTSFSSPTIYSINTFDGSPIYQYMLVFDNISGHTLNDASAAVNAGTGEQFALAENLSTGLTNFTPIGDATNNFTGTLSGSSFSGTQMNSFTISNLTVNTSSDYAGLIGYMNAGDVNNITLINSSITGQNYVGSIIGYMNTGSIENTFSNATVTGASNVGGIVGTNDAGVITDTFYAGTINASGSNIGGIAGSNINGGQISTSIAAATINGGTTVGGVVGDNQALIDDAYSSLATFAGSAVGSDTGTSTNVQAVAAASLTVLPPNFSSSIWQTNGNGYYVSLIMCGTTCRVSTSVSPVTSQAAKQSVTVVAILNNNYPPAPTVPSLLGGSLQYDVPLDNGNQAVVVTVTPDPDPDATAAEGTKVANEAACAGEA